MLTISRKTRLLRSDIIKALYYNKGLSLKELSRCTQKSLPLITSTVNMLVKEETLLEQGLAPSTGGRRALTYLLNSVFQRYLIALSINQLTSRLCIYDLSKNQILPIQSIDLDLASPVTANALIEFINRCITKAQIDRGHVLGVGMGIPRFVDESNGMSYFYHKADGGGKLSSYLSQKLKLPVFLDNDSNLIALAEMNFGEAIGLKDVLIINIGSRTGLGIIINGQLYRGGSGHAGEFSHIPISKSNRLCSCGKRGCLEVETSLQVMVEKAQQSIANGAQTIMGTLFKDKNLTHTEHFLNAAIRQDPIAISILTDAVFQLGKALATLIHIMNPERIVLSGLGAKAGKVLLSPIQQAINEFCIPIIADQTTIVLSKLADQAELIAAASLIIEHSQFEVS